MIKRTDPEIDLNLWTLETCLRHMEVVERFHQKPGFLDEENDEDIGDD